MSPAVVGVAGGSGSGKTTVARAIREAVGQQRVALLAQDSYYRDIDWASPAAARAHNFDHPDALDTDLLIEHVRQLRDGRAVEVPIYDMHTHRRLAETSTVEPRPLILLDGILLLAESHLRCLLDLAIYVDTDADERLMRRLERDIAERGRDLEEVLRQYRETVRPMHREFVEPSKQWADLIVQAPRGEAAWSGGHNEAALREVIARVRGLMDA